jgi:sarcosine oxidase subunit beta
MTERDAAHEPRFVGSHLPSRADVVVVGGGIRGLSIAYSLCKAGATVVVVEQTELLSGASGANVGYVNVSSKEPAFYTQMSLESADRFSNLAAELDADIEYKCAGSITVARTRAEFNTLIHRAAQQNRIEGLHVEVLSASEARDIEPALSRELVGAVYCASDATVNPWKLSYAYAQAAKRLGCRIVQHTRVCGIEVQNGRVSAAVTSRGAIRTDVVVDAAGLGGPAIGEMVGLEIPIVAYRGQVLVSEPVPRLINRPIGGICQDENGNVLIGGTHDLVSCNRAVEYEALRDLARGAAETIPALRGVHVIRAFAGLRPWPIDGLPIMGAVPGGPEGFVCALGHSGVSLAPITGELISEEITTGKTSWSLAEYNLSRFRRTRMIFLRSAYRAFLKKAVPDGLV